MTNIIAPKVHHFYPEAKQIITKVKTPLVPEFQYSPEYESVSLSGISSYTFPLSHYPKRLEDIFIVDNSTGFIVPNRIKVEDTGTEIKYSHSKYKYDVNTRTLTAHTAINGSSGFTLHWIDLAKFQDNVWYKNWVELDIFKDMLTQGVSPDQELPGTFQGGFKCYIQIDTLPVYGMLSFGENFKKLMYRGSSLVTSPYDSFQYRIYNALGQESDAYCIKLQLNS